MLRKHENFELNRDTLKVVGLGSGSDARDIGKLHRFSNFAILRYGKHKIV